MPLIAILNTAEDLEDCRGKLSGKFVLTTAPSNLPAVFQAPGIRLTDQQLEAMANPPQRGAGGGRGGPGGPRANAPTPAKTAGQLCGGVLPAPQAPRGQGGQQGQPNPFPAQRNKFYLDEGVLAVIAPDRRMATLRVELWSFRVAVASVRQIRRCLQRSRSLPSITVFSRAILRTEFPSRWK
jgi:hypothetical protein